jgi:hypothetical protein
MELFGSLHPTLKLQSSIASANFTRRARNLMVVQRGFVVERVELGTCGTKAKI